MSADIDNVRLRREVERLKDRVIRLEDAIRDTITTMGGDQVQWYEPLKEALDDGNGDGQRSSSPG